MSNPTRTMALAATLLAALTGTAAAQPGQDPGGPPPPAGYRPPVPREVVRRGFTFGGGVEVGNMEADSGPIDCAGCDFSPLAGGFDLHIGAMLRPHIALLGELQVTARQLDDAGAEYLQQASFLVALQYWLTPGLWIKGGVGSSLLTIAWDDGYAQGSDDLASGLGLMGAVGYDVLRAPNFAIDVNLRATSGTYEHDEIHAAMLGLGVSWYSLWGIVTVGP